MATLMQKEVGIEIIAAIIATISKHKLQYPQDKQAEEDWKAAVDWRTKLYDSNETEINYSEVIAFKAAISEYDSR